MGPDQAYGTPDDLVTLPFFDAALDDPLEMIVDQDATLRPDDQMFGYQDLIQGHLPDVADKGVSEISSRLSDLDPFTFSDTADSGRSIGSQR
ncbi:MAG: hypothetical protein R3C19_19065 [Planctomycetaceae bacterium]